MAVAIPSSLGAEIAKTDSDNPPVAGLPGTASHAWMKQHPAASQVGAYSLDFFAGANSNLSYSAVAMEPIDAPQAPWNQPPVGKASVDRESTTAVRSEPVWRYSLESLYDRLGRRRGPFGEINHRAVVLKAWMETKQLGAAWLAERIRLESNLDRLEDVETALIGLGKFARQPILQILGMAPSDSQAEVLLRVLRWIDIPSSEHPRLAWILERFSSHQMPELRMVAVRAATKLSVSLRRRLLSHVNARENDPEVLEVIGQQRLLNIS